MKIKKIIMASLLCLAFTTPVESKSTTTSILQYVFMAFPQIYEGYTKYVSLQKLKQIKRNPIIEFSTRYPERYFLDKKNLPQLNELAKLIEKTNYGKENEIFLFMDQKNGSSGAIYPNLITFGTDTQCTSSILPTEEQEALKKIQLFIAGHEIKHLEHNDVTNTIYLDVLTFPLCSLLLYCLDTGSKKICSKNLPFSNPFACYLLSSLVIACASRWKESRADQEAIKELGPDAASGCITYFESKKNKRQSWFEKFTDFFFGTHPSPESRIKWAKEYLKRYEEEQAKKEATQC